MLTREDDVDAHALHRQGWTISAIARHLGHDRKTVRAYLRGQRVAGVRKPASADVFEPYLDYVQARLGEDPHLWAQTLFDEVVELGYARSYPSFTRQLRRRRLRPHCEPCAPARDRPAAVIDHPPGEETQWDWVELPDPPQQWAWGGKAFLLVGALAYSGRWRGVLAASTDQPHLIDALDRTTRALGGLSRVWRFDRMATVCHPASGRITSSFAAVAKHYGVQVAICPPRRGNRKGVVEKANHTAAQRWWRTLADELTPEQAQASLDTWCQVRGDARLRPAGQAGKTSVAVLAEAEHLAPVPARPFPATITVQRVASAQALVAYRGNHYSVPPELARGIVVVTHRLDDHHIDIATSSGVVIARHRLAADGAGVMVRDHGHVHALEHAALAAFTTTGPHRRKQRIPPGPAARAAADQLRTDQLRTDQTRPTKHRSDTGVVIDLARYAAAAQGRNTLT